jgi:putative flippase GtrA
VLGQLAVFAAIGVVSTAGYLALFVLLRGAASAEAANAGALLVSAVANTAANRRLTFGVRGHEGAARAQLQGVLVFVLGLVLTTGSLALLHAATPRPSRAVEVGALVAASAAATALRFVLLRRWVFRPGHVDADADARPDRPVGATVQAPAAVGTPRFAA